MNNFEIVSGYTIGTPYESEVKFLKASLKKFNFNVSSIKGFSNKGTWELNCQEKAKIILDALLYTKKDVVWIDADAELVEYPELFQNIKENLALCFYKNELLSGTIYFKYCEDNIKLIQEWIQKNQENPKMWDQKVLQKIIQEKNLQFCILPITYCKVDFFKTDDKIVIRQNQASRRFKKIINNSNK